MKRQIAAFFLVASFCFILFAWTVPAKNRVLTTPRGKPAGVPMMWYSINIRTPQGLWNEALCQSIFTYERHV